MKKVRIVVKRIACYKDLIEQYENPIEHTCDMKEGQVFIANGFRKPEGFCNSAWESIAPFVKELANGGGNFYDGWMKPLAINTCPSFISQVCSMGFSYCSIKSL